MDNVVIIEHEKKSSIFSKITTIKVGVIPLPLYLAIATIVFTASFFKKLPVDMIGGFAAIMVLGILLGDIGMKVPILNKIGGPAILSVFVPSAMVFYKILQPETIQPITALMKTSNFLYLYVSCLVAGSILGMNRKVLMQGFLRMFIPLLVGTVTAIAAGVGTGLLFGYNIYHTFFFVVVPIISGGISEGILPLSIAYSQILGKAQGDFVAQLVPAALLGNIVAIIMAGLLKNLGEKKPEFSGNGLLTKSESDKELLAEKNVEKPVDFHLMGSGLLIACSVFIFGSLVSNFIPGKILTAPVTMIIAAAIIKFLNIMPAKMEQGAYHIYRFISSSLTWPLLVGLGVIAVPWKDLIRAFTPTYIIICSVTVLAMISSGFFVGKFLKMYPIESALVTGCHSGLGGTGDVAILSASNRMELMPFAQISTRLGGASMVVLATILLKIFS